MTASRNLHIAAEYSHRNDGETTVSKIRMNLPVQSKATITNSGNGNAEKKVGYLSHKL
jgi:hypothetical protein